MASSLPSFCTFTPLSRRKALKYPQVRSQSFKDEGNSADIVDASLSILRERIEEVKKKERLSTYYRQKSGWNYQSAGYDYKHKRDAVVSESIEFVGFISGALGLVFVCGSFWICLVSLVVHLCK